MRVMEDYVAIVAYVQLDLEAIKLLVNSSLGDRLDQQRLGWCSEADHVTRSIDTSWTLQSKPYFQ